MRELARGAIEIWIPVFVVNWIKEGVRGITEFFALSQIVE
jgi:hypothetical protein